MGNFSIFPSRTRRSLISSFSGGEVFRSGCTFTRGAARIFYFRPGHETYPTYYDANVLRVIANAVYWVAPRREVKALEFGNRKAGWLDGAEK